MAEPTTANTATAPQTEQSSMAQSGANKPPSEPVANATDSAQPEGLLGALGHRFGAFFTVFGSAAAVGTFLMYAGFMSDFGVYRMADLPRMRMNWTSQIESGADVMVDTLSLLSGSPLRGLALISSLLLIILIWGHRHSPRTKAWMDSRGLFQLIRLLTLLVAILLFSAMVDRVQRSLSGEHHSQQSTLRALESAYAKGFPTPYERSLAIERESYEVRYYRLPSFGARLDIGLSTWWERLRGREAPAMTQDQGIIGIPLRHLPEAQQAARQVYGWLTISVLLLALAVVVMGWWAQALPEQLPPQSDGASWTLALPEPTSAGSTGTNVGPTPVPVPARELASPVPLWVDRISNLWLGNAANEPLQRMVAPLTVVLVVLSLALLPLAHGLLARKSIGAETVMVLLKKDEKKLKDAPATKDPSDINIEPAAGLTDGTNAPQGVSADAYQCDTRQIRSELKTSQGKVREASRDFVHIRPTSEEAYNRALDTYGAQVERLASTAVKANCADILRDFWASRPPEGLRAIHPVIADRYERELQKVLMTYGVRIGTILAYPRENEGLMMARSMVPKPLRAGGQSSVLSIDSKDIVESIVLPDFKKRRLAEIRDTIKANPDSLLAGELLDEPSVEGLQVALPILKRQDFIANRAGVTVTALGGMAMVSAIEQPALATEAIDFLANLSSTDETLAWPAKNNSTRGAALTALHLSRTPYAAFKFAQVVLKDQGRGCAGTGQTLPPVQCLPTSTTAAGYLLQDLQMEAQLFPEGQVPASLTSTKATLVSFLVSIATQPDVRDDVRGAACSALTLAGFLRAPTDVTQKFLANISVPDTLTRFPFSTPACLQAGPRLGVAATDMRSLLKQFADGKIIPASLPPNERVRSRRSALVVLSDLDLSNEVDFLFKLLVAHDKEEDRALGELAESLLSEVDADRMSDRLIDCIDPKKQNDDFTRTQCLQSFKKLQRSFDGDGGAMATLHRWTRDKAIPHDASCEVLVSYLEDRSGKWLKRLPKDDAVMTDCKTRKTDRGSPEGNLTQLRALLQQLQQSHED